MRNLNSIVERIKFKISFFESQCAKKFVTECNNEFREILKFSTYIVCNQKNEKKIIILEKFYERNKI